MGIVSITLLFGVTYCIIITSAISQRSSLSDALNFLNRNDRAILVPNLTLLISLLMIYIPFFFVAYNIVSIGLTVTIGILIVISFGILVKVVLYQQCYGFRYRIFNDPDEYKKDKKDIEIILDDLITKNEKLKNERKKRLIALDNKKKV